MTDEKKKAKNQYSWRELCRPGGAVFGTPTTYPYAPNRLVRFRDDRGDRIVENDRAHLNAKQGEAAMERKKHPGSKWAVMLTREAEFFAQWVVEQKRKGRDEIELTWETASGKPELGWTRTSGSPRSGRAARSKITVVGHARDHSCRMRDA